MENASGGPASETSHRPAFGAAGSLFVAGVALGAAFFPMFFDRWAAYDDEGVFTVGVRELLAGHGHLYSTIWSDLYGPFYYLFMTTVFRVIHQQPNLENSRWILLVLTVASTALFGGAVWRIVKSVPGALVAQVAAFVLLVPGAGFEASHPGTLEVFLVAIVAFEIASYVATHRTAHLVGLGVAIGALTMTKVNAGGLVAVAVVLAFVVGNREMPRRLQLVVAGVAALVPIVFVYQRLSAVWAAMIAVLLVFSIVGVILVMWIDQIPLSRWPLVPIALGAAAAILCSLAFPLFYGTSLSDEIEAVFIRPLTFADRIAISPTINFDWLAFVVTVAGVAGAYAFRSFSKERVRAQATWVHAALAALALWTLGLGVTSNPMGHAIGYPIGKWLPIIVVLPALIVCARSDAPFRFALRLFVGLAVLQFLVAYPVAGTQVAWGTVTMTVPCAIALAVGLDHSRAWRESKWLVRAGATTVVCVALVIAVGVLPTSAWKNYRESAALDLPGTGLIRIGPQQAREVRNAARLLRQNCDTFYGIPNLNSFHVFTGIQPLTGMVANGGPAGLTAAQQQQVLDAIQRKLRAGERVCVLRHPYPFVTPTPRTPLGRLLKQFNRVVARSGTYTIARHR